MTAAAQVMTLDPGASLVASRATSAPRDAPAWLATARWVLTSAAGLAVWLVLFATLASGLEAGRTQSVLYAKFRQQLAEGTAPVSAPIGMGAPVATMSIAAIGLKDVVVVQGAASRQLIAGPGHRPDTVLPGQVGVSVLYGRALSYGAPFAELTSLSKGDSVVIVTGQGHFTYVVQGTRRAGDLVSAPAAGTGRLTLVTAEGTGRLGRWVPRSAVYVDALLTKAAPAGKVQPVAGNQLPMRGDRGALVPLVLWLEVLLAAALGCVVVARRWGGRQAWLVGAVVLLAAAWGASESAWALMPNLL